MIFIQSDVLWSICYLPVDFIFGPLDTFILLGIVSACAILYRNYDWHVQYYIQFIYIFEHRVNTYKK